MGYSTTKMGPASALAYCQQNDYVPTESKTLESWYNDNWHNHIVYVEKSDHQQPKFYFTLADNDFVVMEKNWRAKK